LKNKGTIGGREMSAISYEAKKNSMELTNFYTQESEEKEE
jgi:hypothetical protein